MGQKVNEMISALEQKHGIAPEVLDRVKSLEDRFYALEISMTNKLDALLNVLLDREPVQQNNSLDVDQMKLMVDALTEKMDIPGKAVSSVSPKDTFIPTPDMVGIKSKTKATASKTTQEDVSEHLDALSAIDMTEEKHVCDYGCGQEGKVLLKSGRWCCSDNYNRCPGMLAKRFKRK